MSELASSTRITSLTASLRDLAGRLFRDRSGVLRVVNPVGITDPGRSLARLHLDLTPELFERFCRRRFHVVRVQHEGGATRWPCLPRKR